MNRSYLVAPLRVFSMLFILACGACGASSTSGGTHDGGGNGDAGHAGDGGGGGGDGGNGGGDAGTPDGGSPPIGTPITAPKDTWTWVDFPDSACDDGSATGIGVNITDASTNLLVFFNGGGACWDYTTCYVLNTATHGPFTKANFDSMVGGLGGSLMDRNTADNPFKDYSFVFVPYCTGDVHAGDNLAVYTGAGGSKTYHHVGHANALAFLKRIAPTFPSPGKLVVSGSSAGGAGVLFNYADFRAYWPTGKVYLLDDSLPVFEGDDIAPALRNSWYASWRVDKVLDPLCGTACKSDLSLAVRALAARYPNDRMALLSSLQDQTIRSYYQLQPAAFQADLLKMSTDILEPTPNFKYFFIPGQSHTMLGNPANYTSSGTVLQTWLTRFATDDAAWASTKP